MEELVSQSFDRKKMAGAFTGERVQISCFQGQASQFMNFVLLLGVLKFTHAPFLSFLIPHFLLHVSSCIYIYTSESIDRLFLHKGRF
uniref:Uncharacterized protein n=1 Tax=Salix viminalis TaxID=40686 RepID=A0A6N2L519_SALVM